METAPEPPALEAPAADDLPAPPRRFLPNRGDLVVCFILMAFSAWLWSRAMSTLGMGAPFLGAAIGLAVAFLVREFC